MCLAKETQLLYEKYANSNFVSYFLNVLHDESNSFLVFRSNQINFEETKSNDMKQNENAKILTNKNGYLEDSYNSSFSIISPKPTDLSIRNSPTDYSNIIFSNKNNKRRTLPGQSSFPSSLNEQAAGSINAEVRNSPTEFSNIVINNKNKRKTLCLQSASTPKVNTPTFASKLSSKPSLFDFVTSPPLQTQTSTSKVDAINDFKARFYQHQNKLDKIDQNMQNLKLDSSDNNSKQIIDFKAAILEKLSRSQTDKLTLLAEFYANLLLSIE